MKKGAYIQSDQKQLLGAKIAKHALETTGGLAARSIPVTIMQVEDIPVFTKFTGMTYRRGEEIRTHDEKDLQFFTLSRFMPPELMGYEGRAVVIDPDIFALQDIGELFDVDLGEHTLAACRKKNAWDTSVMALQCGQLKHWNIQNILEGLRDGIYDYREWMQLKNEGKVLEIDRVWNSLDEVTPETKMLHTTIRATQPWKTGLPVDFTPGTIPKLFGFIPRIWVRQPTHYLPHPNPNIEALFFSLAKKALSDGAITREEIENEIQKEYVRSDLLERIENN
jgi:hypothetical protein